MTTPTMTNETAADILRGKLRFAKQMANDINALADELAAAPADMLPDLPIATDGSVLISGTRLALSVMDGSWTTTRYTNERCGTGALRLRVTGTVNSVSLEGYVEIKNGFAYGEDREIVGRKLFANVTMNNDKRASASEAARAKIRVAVENHLADAGLTCEDLDSVGIIKTAINKVRTLVVDMKTYIHASEAERAIDALEAAR